MSELPNKERSPKRIVYAIIASLVVASTGSIIFIEYDNVVNADVILRDDYPLGNYECEGWVQEGTVLVMKYHPFSNMELWSIEDRTKMIDLENNVLYHCSTKKIDVIQNLPLCLETFVIIKGLLDEMVEMEIQSLSEVDQDRYYSNYDKYFGSGCDLLQDDIDQILSENDR